MNEKGPGLLSVDGATIGPAASGTAFQRRCAVRLAMTGAESCYEALLIS